jgi:multiple sugar transport system substrate-binding protein
MKRSMVIAIGIAAATALALAGCSGSDDEGSDAATDGASAAPVTLSLAGWSLASTPEFQTLADGFHAENPDVTVDVKEYDATNYDTQMIADLAAGSAPDIYVLKNLKNFYTYQSGGQLEDVSDVADGLGEDVNGLSAYRSTARPMGFRTGRTPGTCTTTRTCSTRRGSTTPTAPGPGTTTPPRRSTSPRA